MITRDMTQRAIKQEIEADIDGDVEGALWTQDLIDANRVDPELHGIPPLHRLIVAIDPATTAKDSSDETGICVAGLAGDHVYVLADLSLRASPHGWASVAVKAYYQYRADRIIGESNNGGDMVENTLRTVDPNIPVSLVWASRGKLIRAEPVAALYEQNRVHHVGVFTELENEMTQWLPGMSSPSRMDAMVWALTELALGVDNKMRIYDNHPWLDRV
jgi:phage terminase large subunit-like protein